MDRRSFIAAAAAALVAPRAAAALAAPSPRRAVVLATADLEARLVAVDLGTGAILDHIPTEPYPRSIETVGNTAVVAHSDIGAVSLVDGRTWWVKHVLRELGEPRYTAGHPDGRHAFVTDAQGGELVTIDLATAAVVARVAIGPLARHVSIDRDGTTVWAALGSKAEEIAVVDVKEPRAPRLVRRIRPPFLAHDVCWAPGGMRVWVSAGASRELAIYDRGGHVVARRPADAPPQHITFDGNTAYVTSGLSGTLRRHALNGRHLSLTHLPEGSYNVQYSHGRVVTPALGHGSLCVLSAGGQLLNREQIATSSHDASVVVA